jgi:hypothetical protein
VPTSPNDLPSLLARHAALDARLEALVAGETTVTADERALLKADIIALLRAIDRELAALTALRDEAKTLATKWKRVPAAPSEDAPPPPNVEPLTTRVDHLGASTFVSKGWTAISVGDYAAAESALSRALALAPEDLEAASLLGWALMGQGGARLDEALAGEHPL